jgi:hypothetical protein
MQMRFERCHTGSSGARPGLGRLAHSLIIDRLRRLGEVAVNDPLLAFGPGWQPDQLLRVRCSLRHMDAFKIT